MSQRSIRSPRSVVRAVLASLVLIFASSIAAADPAPHQISWGHPSPGTVRNFVVLISDEEGDFAGARQVDVGKPAGSPLGGLTLFSAVVAFEQTQFVAVAAMGYNGLLSLPSDWSAMPPTNPGQPRPTGL